MKTSSPSATSTILKLWAEVERLKQEASVLEDRKQSILKGRQMYKLPDGSEKDLVVELNLKLVTINRAKWDTDDKIMDIIGDSFFKLSDGRILLACYDDHADRTLGIYSEFKS